MALILSLVLGTCLLVPSQAAAQTEVRVYWGVGIFVGGLSVFFSFRSGDLSKNETDVKTVENKEGHHRRREYSPDAL
jgi:hypothetical protein